MRSPAYLIVGLVLLCAAPAPAQQPSHQDLYADGAPYIKYFADRALLPSTGFGGLTRSFQLNMDIITSLRWPIIEYGAAAYDMS
ncbi:MAG: hypothetical protein K8I00_00060, partial [Candidatus Omnitrophica bacterium]|nr:hypothetical protein [Candidatus Omnitrophota bacterium]